MVLSKWVIPFAGVTAALAFGCSAEVGTEDQGASPPAAQGEAVDSTQQGQYYNPAGYNPPGVGPLNPPGYNPPGMGGVYNPAGYNPPGVGPLTPPGYNPPGYW
jgi:hypothetical protein